MYVENSQNNILVCHVLGKYIWFLSKYIAPTQNIAQCVGSKRSDWIWSI
jgi:hypothetical protein